MPVNYAQEPPTEKQGTALVCLAIRHRARVKRRMAPAEKGSRPHPITNDTGRRPSSEEPT